MGFFSWIFIGLVAGVLGKFLLPGRDPGGCFLTVGIGVVGALIGGFLATQLGFGGISGFDLGSIATATAGAVVFLLILRLFKRGAD